MAFSDWVLGKPIATENDDAQRVGPIAGVGVLGLDALASASYGPEALLTMLLPLGVYGLSHLGPLIAAIIALLAIIAISYRQTIAAYPNGGGAYTVAKENLGPRVALLAAAALGLDYILNAAVAVSAGVGALVSAIPELLPYTLPLCLSVVIFLMMMNLRGVRATGAALLLPTYAFVVLLFSVIGIGLWKTITSGGAPVPVVPPVAVQASVTVAPLYLLVRAFANGCTAMTGVEAVSNGVPVFKEPARRGAQRTLALIVGILMVLLAGVAILCISYKVTATPPGQVGYQSVLSQVIGAVVGRGPLYYVTVGSVVLVLTLSANTSFAALPRVCSILADDGYLPEPFLHRGRRLAFSHGVVALGLLAGVLLIVFDGITEGLIPLFAVGALSAFTLSQIGMIAHWRKHRTKAARRGLVLNVVGALATGATLLVVLISKFDEGAWISIVLVGGMLMLFRTVRRHYHFIAHATASDAKLELPAKPVVAVVPLRRWDAVSRNALQFALGTTPDVIAVQVLTGDGRVEDLTERWDSLVSLVRESEAQPPKLVILRSERRELFRPLMGFVTQLAQSEPDRQIAVVVPELVEQSFYHRLLHNQTAAVMKALVFLRGGARIVVFTVPWYLRDWLPERRSSLPARGLPRRRARVRSHTPGLGGA